MPTNQLAPHNAACTELFNIFLDCKAEHPLGRFFGTCSSQHTQLRKCLKAQRLIKQAENRRLAEIRNREIREKMRLYEDREYDI